MWCRLTNSFTAFSECGLSGTLQQVSQAQGNLRDGFSWKVCYCILADLPNTETGRVPFQLVLLFWSACFTKYLSNLSCGSLWSLYRVSVPANCWWYTTIQCPWSEKHWRGEEEEEEEDCLCLGFLPWWFLNMCSTCPLTCMYKIQYILARGELGFTWFQGENPLSFPQQLTMSYALNSKLKTKDFVTTGLVSEGQILQWNSCCNLASNSYG